MWLDSKCIVPKAFCVEGLIASALNCCFEHQEVLGRELDFSRSSKLKSCKQCIGARGSIACTGRRLCTCFIGIRQGSHISKQMKIMNPEWVVNCIVVLRM